MSEFLFFIIGTMLGGLFDIACMCCLQINRLSERKKVDNFRLTFAKGICFHAGHRNGGLRDMGCAWLARPSN